MNLSNLKKAEQRFLSRYPEGFFHPDMVAIGKKHRMSKMTDMAQQCFGRDVFLRPQTVIDNMVKIISASSMVSMFEKPKFKSFAGSMDPLEKDLLSHGLEEQLYGNQQQGFDIMMEVLQTRKIAKWTLMTICPVYFNPLQDVFVKPTTVKGIIRYLEIDNLVYRPQPDWSFYSNFRNTVNELKTKVDPSLSPNNAAFTGFLMMSMGVE